MAGSIHQQRAQRGMPRQLGAKQLQQRPLARCRQGGSMGVWGVGSVYVGRCWLQYAEQESELPANNESWQDRQQDSVGLFFIGTELMSRTLVWGLHSPSLLKRKKAAVRRSGCRNALMTLHNTTLTLLAGQVPEKTLSGGKCIGHFVKVGRPPHRARAVVGTATGGWQTASMWVDGDASISKKNTCICTVAPH